MANNRASENSRSAKKCQETLAQQNRDEQDALLAAMHQLEAALATAAPGREEAWNRAVIEKLRGVADSLAEHVASAEAPDGLLAEIDTRPNLGRRVERLRREHTDVLQQARALQRQVEQAGENDVPDFQDIRQRSAWLLNALRHHQALENDLIFESFYTDFGLVD
jgi:hypothetical protein